MAYTVSAPQGVSDSQGDRNVDATSWIVGIVLILLGVAFLLENSGFVILPGNWWAVFIYLAAIASFANAWRLYRATGQFGATATGSLTWGLVFTVVASIFFFNLVWDVWWPVILVAIGVGIVVGNLLGTYARRRGDTGLG
jgi:hypothetical protein